MGDIPDSRAACRAPDRTAPDADAALDATVERKRDAGAIPYELIELLFFAYRDFTGDPDAILAEFGFGRAHHRVIHFVQRNPGLSVAELLDILRITKQSLGRVLKDLVRDGFVESRPGPADRRQRLLHVTPKGRALALRLVEPQSRRIRRALACLGPEGAAAARAFLERMINESDREAVLTRINSSGETP